MEMAFRPTLEHEVWQADVGCVSQERDDATGDDEYLMGSPKLVVEVVSPGNPMQETNEKRAICLDNGCASFWVVGLKHQRVSVSEGNTTGHGRVPLGLLKSWYSGGFMLTEHPLLNAVIFASLGIAVFALAAAILLKATPLQLWRELVQERNVAVAIFAGAAAIGICLIIAAAMH
jgi:putative membrane protein